MTKRQTTEAEVSMASISVNVSISPNVNGYVVQVNAVEPKFDTEWMTLPLIKPFKIQIGKKAKPPALGPVTFNVRLRNAPHSSANYEPNTPPTSVFWQGELSGDMNIVFILPNC